VKRLGADPVALDELPIDEHARVAATLLRAIPQLIAAERLARGVSADIVAVADTSRSVVVPRDDGRAREVFRALEEAGLTLEEIICGDDEPPSDVLPAIRSRYRTLAPSVSEAGSSRPRSAAA
jgi:hypothetical protein